MKTITLTASFFSLFATAASASMTVGSFDTNGDRFVTYTELTAVLPTLSRSDFRALDMNDDRRLSANEVSRLDAQTIFGRHVETPNDVRGLLEIDANGDRFASFSELTAAYPGFHRSDFEQIDLNDDRRVSQTELYGDVAQSVLTRYEGGSSIPVSMNELDVDGSGFASISEMTARYPGLSVLDFKEVDRNRDNRISFEELYDPDTIAVLGGKL